MDHLVIGVDCATDESEVGLAAAWHTSLGLQLAGVAGASPSVPAVSTICQWLDGVTDPVLLALDAPLAQAAARSDIVTSLACAMDVGRFGAALVANADLLDAAVCALAGHDFLKGECESPVDEVLARREGWIWVKARAPYTSP